jgi:hypothetical protein
MKQSESCSSSTWSSISSGGTNKSNSTGSGSVICPSLSASSNLLQGRGDQSVREYRFLDKSKNISSADNEHNSNEMKEDAVPQNAGKTENAVPFFIKSHILHWWQTFYDYL